MTNEAKRVSDVALSTQITFDEPRCYAVTRLGAQKLLDVLKPMWLPYDIAFERSWSTGVGTYTTRDPLVDFLGDAAASAIGTRTEYRRAKLPKMQQIPTALFRGTEYVARSLYSFGKS